MQARALNRARWELLAQVHGQDATYDSAALIAGADSLHEEENAALRAAAADLAGLDVLHVQCHIGFDTISLARRGARMTGVDFSARALERAARLADQAGATVRWVEADSTTLPGSLARAFDLAYATVGVLTWIDDVGAWMRSVAGVLRPGGRLVLVDAHPLMDMIQTTDPLTFDMPYANNGGHVFTSGETYADPSLRLPETPSVNYAHSLGEIVSAAADAGLQIRRLVEHLDLSFEFRRGIVSRESDGRFRLRVGGEALPVLFTLIAALPA